MGGLSRCEFSRAHFVMFSGESKACLRCDVLNDALDALDATACHAGCEWRRLVSVRPAGALLLEIDSICRVQAILTVALQVNKKFKLVCCCWFIDASTA